MEFVKRWFSLTYLSMLLLVLLVAVVIAGFVLVLKAQTAEVNENEQFTRCVLTELGNHQSRAEDIYAAIARNDPDHLDEVLRHPPTRSSCIRDLTG